MTIDLGSINTVQEIHLKFKTELGFSDDYKMNWNAFWEAISSLSDLEEDVSILHFKHIEEILPSDADILRELIMDFNRLDGEYEMAIENEMYE
ncbi:barstar family protein [Paracrocinitomix mangrovi]|uniref:barstar family protein n=1 Tax=Paracrocinitomix mangrovi TaxID=2862509 RepID=UPI001C8DCFAF|nr:barstar family protein [Paracrocinitomix mangrovi]UKN02587.1 barstar family protein [Paracrocinitomix mangrovi]